MNNIKITSIILMFLAVFSSSCSKDDASLPQQEILNSELKGLLGERVLITGKNLEPNKLQVFFDTEKASITSFSNESIEVIIPRSIERFNPIIKVVDLITNEDILNEVFILNAPRITSFGSGEISFDEILVINGENFDNRKENLAVLINDEKAEILNATHSKLEVYIPKEIRNSSLEVTVEAQFQTTKSSQNLKLKQPIINEVTNETAWLGGYLYLVGKYFNPEFEYGELYVNGVRAHYTSSNTGLTINVPTGPYSEFKISNITYKTAGLVSSFDLDLEIGNIGIMVDGLKNLFGEIIVYNNKAYAITSENNGDFNITNYLYEFSPDTEKWNEIEDFRSTGFIRSFVFDNENSIYFYTGVENEVNELTKLSLDTFIETKIQIPFDPSLINSTFLVRDGDLYVINGRVYKNDRYEISNRRYQYFKDESIWKEITSELFTGFDWKRGTIFKYIYLDDDLYFKYFDRETFKLDENNHLTQMTVDNMLFLYDESIICRRTNIVNDGMLLYTLEDPYNGVELQFGREGSSVKCFFTVNNEIYYNMLSAFYDGNVHNATFRIKKDKLNEIL
ncbi:IPT/TIG domain-containing protein [Leeuwenhoekiella sp. NPDC079379]|uniref:IPT/TIG domain-containing protein n=1 Tax=Leeuwenhoekiella sp. NPDC079379 TaxID=3364122 RepID=UPI0037C53A6D